MESPRNPHGEETQSAERTGGKATPGRGGRPGAVVPDWHPVMREQLEYLMEHVANGLCGCAECHRYLRVRTALLEIFKDRPPR